MVRWLVAAALVAVVAFGEESHPKGKHQRNRYGLFGSDSTNANSNGMSTNMGGGANTPFGNSGMGLNGNVGTMGQQGQQEMSQECDMKGAFLEGLVVGSGQQMKRTATDTFQMSKDATDDYLYVPNNQFKQLMQTMGAQYDQATQSYKVPCNQQSPYTGLSFSGGLHVSMPWRMMSEPMQGSGMNMQMSGLPNQNSMTNSGQCFERLMIKPISQSQSQANGLFQRLRHHQQPGYIVPQKMMPYLCNAFTSPMRYMPSSFGMGGSGSMGMPSSMSSMGSSASSLPSSISGALQSLPLIG